ncbi:MAG TPA: hypothetical protein VGR57_01560 [Ktedonobacterales bacterium]|nr:hypothetical protein [Ktedonobacterales bacterium]
MADTSAPARPQRAPALLSTIGGALMIVSFFLPNYASTIGPDRSPALLTLWDAILSAGNLAQNQGSGSSQPHVFVAVLFGIPLVMGVVIAALGVVGLLRASGDLLRGFGVAAAIFALVSSLIQLVYATIVTAFNSAIGGQTGVNQSLVGLGSVTLVLGLFLGTAAAFAQPRRAA